ncbi:hypothetical protein D3C77_610400 [compost metagenome]
MTTVVAVTTPALIVVIIVVIVTTTVAMTTVIIIFPAHVVAQGTAHAATGCRADQAASGAAHLATYHVTAGCAQCAANGCFATAVFVGAHRTTGRATQAGADCRAGAAANRLADHRA